MARINFNAKVDLTNAIVEESSAKKIISEYFANELSSLIFSEFLEKLEFVEEIRVRVGHKIHLYILGKDMVLNNKIITQNDVNYILERMNKSSVYAYEEGYKNGYLTLSGGHRVGLCGKVLLKDGMVKTIREVSALNIRIAKNIYGVADELKKYVLTGDRVKNVLLVGPPKSGKTTILREMVRLLSDGIWGTGKNVAVVDERSEIAGCFNAVAQLDVGERTDVMDACYKSEGMLMMLRSMSPDVLAVDEIATMDDVSAIEKAIGSGVAILSTAHASCLEDLKKRKPFFKMLNEGYFEVLIFLSNNPCMGSVKWVYEFNTTYERVV